MAYTPNICLLEFCLVDADIFNFVLPVSDRMWLHDKAVGAPDLRRHFGRSQGEHIPEMGTTRRLAIVRSLGSTVAVAVRRASPMAKKAPGYSEAAEPRRAPP